MAARLLRETFSPTPDSAFQSIMSFVEGLAPKGVQKHHWQQLLVLWGEQHPVWWKPRKNPAVVRQQIENFNGLLGDLQWCLQVHGGPPYWREQAGGVQKLCLYASVYRYKRFEYDAVGCDVRVTFCPWRLPEGVCVKSKITSVGDDKGYKLTPSFNNELLSTEEEEDGVRTFVMIKTEEDE